MQSLYNEPSVFQNNSKPIHATDIQGNSNFFTEKIYIPISMNLLVNENFQIARN